MNRKKILIVSSSPVNGNAGNIVYLLYNALSSKELYDVWILSSEDPSSGRYKILTLGHKTPYRMVFTRKLCTFMKRVARKLKRTFVKPKTISKYAFFELDIANERFSSDMVKRSIGFVPDVIIITFNVKFITMKNVSDLCEPSTKVIYYLMDMDPLTGGCHYSWSCNRYEEKCIKCPALVSSKFGGFPSRNQCYRKHYINKLNAQFVCASSGLMDLVSKSYISSSQAKYLLYTSADTDFFRPQDKHEAKKALGIDNDYFTMLFVASSLLDPRKGFETVSSALNKIEQSDFESHPRNWMLLVVAGAIPKDIGVNIDSKHYSNVPFNEMPRFYNASDVYISASNQDSGPWSVNQSILCGTPVIASREGVALDLITDGETGYLFDIGDSEALACMIKKYFDLSVKEKNRMNENCSRLSEEKLSLDRYRDNWINYIESII